MARANDYRNSALHTIRETYAALGGKARGEQIRCASQAEHAEAKRTHSNAMLKCAPAPAIATRPSLALSATPSRPLRDGAAD